MAFRFGRATLMLALLAVLLLATVPALADDGEEATDPEAGDPPGHLNIVAALAAEFTDYGLDLEEVEALYAAGVGFGEIFKLQLMAITEETTITDLLAQLTGEDGELDLAYGEWKHSLTPEELALLEGLPANLGQLVSATHRPEHAGQGQGHSGQGHAYGHAKHGGGD